MKKILLIGADFNNKGAEAMALITIIRFQQLYSGCQITMASYAKKENIPYGIHTISPPSGNGKSFSFKLIKNPRFKKIIVPLVRSLLFCIFPFPKVRVLLLKSDLYLQHFAQADLVVDLSGFAISDQWNFRRRLAFCFEIFTSRCMGKPFIIFTQALGPFEKISSRILAKLFLPKVDLLIARGKDTFEHLRQIGLTQRMDIPICADSAFLLPPASSEDVDRILGNQSSADKPLFGIIPNIRIFRRTLPSDERNSYIQLLVKLSNYVQSELQSIPVFICHVNSPPQTKDDWLIRQVIKQAEHPERIIVVTADHSASELKAVIGRLDFLIASRFHSIVAAISMTTPFLAVGWAHKYRELVADVNMESYVFNALELHPEKFFETLKKAWNDRDTIRQHLAHHHHTLQASAEDAFRLVAEKWPE